MCLSNVVQAEPCVPPPPLPTFSPMLNNMETIHAPSFDKPVIW